MEARGKGQELCGLKFTSLRRRVPSGVPSQEKTSRSSFSPLAEKKSVAPTSAKLLGREEGGPGRMSLKRAVPSRVPSVVQIENERPPKHFHPCSSGYLSLNFQPKPEFLATVLILSYAYPP